MYDIDTEKFYSSIQKWMKSSLRDLKVQAKQRRIYLYSRMPKLALARALALLEVQQMN